MAPIRSLLINLVIFCMGAFALAIPVPVPIPKDNKMITEPVDLGRKTGKIGVDNVDLSRLRVDPVKVELHNREENVEGSPVMEHEIMRPSPYFQEPAAEQRDPVVEKRDMPHLVDMMARSEQEAQEAQAHAEAEEDGAPGVKYIPRWRPEYNAGYHWLEGA
ncbi:hypothetical protein CkaCkLH20_04393 [Colletotrichum karsti]|uniref:Uncharacterized protein n=1 Tax=Colletotrichum karsti TaxID=1095194 RepID=A0A9P6LMF8_9PEZI|nr:uncharacterized protein CkaCkLH20_04393 [Colletotrichum karsti]KAF9878355.1 hypothetical protein CkaCkLH20_04393 [Colletotrichum karsti]